METTLTTSNLPNDPANMRRVVAAAIKLKDGRILCGVRHFDHIMRSWLPAEITEARPFIAGAEQGFVDNRYQFMDRNEAWDVAVAANQLLPNHDGIEGQLFSEDLW